MELFVKLLPEDEKKWFPCECPRCGWVGSSEQLKGGGQIADTGDYDDTYCPVCDYREPDEPDNLIPLQSYIERLEKAHKLVREYKDRYEGCDHSKHIYGYYEQQNAELIKELNALKEKYEPLTQQQ